MDQLKVHNSLKPGAPVPFVPIEPGKVSWNYAQTDIIRRIMRDYFGFKIKFVMNITDIDDKIILKTRRQKLLELEKSKTYTESELSKLAAQAFQAYAQGNLPELLKHFDGSDLSPGNYARDIIREGKPGDDETKMKMHINNLNAATKAIQDNRIFGGADEILLPYLDSLYKHTIDARDHTIFTDVTQYWEADFMKDMDALNIMRPDVVTRVTTYVPQIATFVEKIVQKGFAYEADGSVYFDIAAFEKAGNPYARLRPESRNDKALQEEGEGSLSKNLGGKRGAGDFALWKKSKSGEPSWPSPWGEGRPGWHIECSVMASDVLGAHIDIHSGGIDLAFPHHDNELAQSEAYYCENGHEHIWVNYFMHMGHLSISGSKMSKSLKNFQTIQDALKTDFTPRGMRIVFLLSRWNQGIEISPDMRTMAEGWESSLNSFFIKAKSHIAEANGRSVTEDVKSLSLNGSGDELQVALKNAEAEMQAALLDSFDTPRAMRCIDKLIKDFNIHEHAHKTNMDVRGLENIARWITKMVGIFGLDANASPPHGGIGWASTSSNSNLSPAEIVAPYAEVLKRVKAEVNSLNVHSETLDQLLSTNPETEFEPLSRKSNNPETLALPYLRNISRIRDTLRTLAPTSTSKKQILIFSDQIRDSDLLNLGVYLDDRPDNQPALIKFIPASELLAQKEEKAAKEREKAAQKEKVRLDRERVEFERTEKAKNSHLEMYKGDEKWSAWDADGIPTRTKEGEDVPKSALKKLRKDWEKQKKVHEEWKAKNGT
ncbi:Cysteinyl-tRNA synthetase [Hyphodiscus hymeniophilus]|uniref:cysteine--tRNA ligase n=1 Tax=Hyphodiscus hymeniophilus TaxID=353542 RepID=A0A9P7AUM9_9HELO|nr:Cysteinyl-tRNA synthetase [Hyphodiscus hymeniophilus]